MQTCTGGSLCKLHDPRPPDLLIQCRRSALIDVLDFIHGRFWDVVGKPFQSITGGGTLLPSGAPATRTVVVQDAPRRSGWS
jgi:hypothetical protein